jgi:hypothetical protein
VGAVSIGLLVSGGVFLAGLIGLYGHLLLPISHRSKETEATVRLGTAMLSLLSSLVLGLLIASAKGSWDANDHAVRAYAADLVLLDQTLRDYGGDAVEPRALLREYTGRMIRDIWPNDGPRKSMIEDRATGEMLERMRERIRALAPLDEPAKWLQDQALATHISLLRQRWQLIEQQEPTVRNVVLMFVVSWIVVIFASFGLNAPRNIIVVGTFLVCSLAIGGSIFLILEMDNPFTGALAISSEPMSRAIAHMQEK